MRQTIPIEINEEKKEELIFKKNFYKLKNKVEKCEEIVTITNETNTPIKPIINKSPLYNWYHNTTVIFNDLEEFKNKKINLKNIFKINIDKDQWNQNGLKNRRNG